MKLPKGSKTPDQMDWRVTVVRIVNKMDSVDPTPERRASKESQWHGIALGNARSGVLALNRAGQGGGVVA